MVMTIPTVIIHFMELRLEATAIMYIDAKVNANPNQYRTEIWLKTKSTEESIDKG
jgi:hypothetical protein